MDTIVYSVDGFWREMGDHRVHKDYPMMSGGPMPIVLIVCAYVYFVRVIGPRFMKSKEPYDLRWPIRIYNILMSAINYYMFHRTALLTNFGTNYFGCHQVGKTHEDNELVPIAYLYFATKIVELLDTVFFILRKKYSQASNLHVFHHGFIAICVWVYLKTAPGGSSVLFPFLNSGVHAIMYGYYFLATYKSMQKYLWWKRYLTLAQIVQFVMSMVHFSFKGLSSCEYPATLAIIGFIANFIFLCLFIDFYKHAYLNVGSRKQKDAPASAQDETSCREERQLSEAQSLRNRSAAQLQSR